MLSAQFRRGISLVAALAMVGISQAVALAGHVPLYDANGYVDDFNTVLNGLVDVGESTAYIDPGTNPPALPAITPISGPISTGVVTGQFDIACSGGTATSGCGVPNDTTNPANVAYAQGAHDFGWAILDATDDMNLVFLSNGGGQSFFPSNNFTGITFNPDPSASQENRRFLHFAFDIAGSGLSMVPGRTYVLLALLGNNNAFGAQTIVPGEAGGFGSEIDAYITATSNWFSDVSTHQLHDPIASSYFDFGSGVFGTQAVTSRLIPVVPEPTTALLLMCGAGLLVVRRRAQK